MRCSKSIPGNGNGNLATGPTKTRRLEQEQGGASPKFSRDYLCVRVRVRLLRLIPVSFSLLSPNLCFLSPGPSSRSTPISEYEISTFYTLGNFTLTQAPRGRAVCVGAWARGIRRPDASR
jgi:hypothetical protein